MTTEHRLNGMAVVRPVDITERLKTGLAAIATRREKVKAESLEVAVAQNWEWEKADAERRNKGWWNRLWGRTFVPTYYAADELVKRAEDWHNGNDWSYAPRFFHSTNQDYWRVDNWYCEAETAFGQLLSSINQFSVNQLDEPVLYVNVEVLRWLEVWNRQP